MILIYKKFFRQNNTKNNRNILKRTILNLRNIYIFILLLFINTSCEEPSVIGLDIQPPSDLIHAQYTDTITIHAVSAREDSVRSDRTSMYLLGSINDPVFGFSNASFATQIRLPASNITFPENITVDSVVLSITHKGFYGHDKYANPITIEVWELDEAIRIDTTYYSNKSIQKKSLLGSRTLIPNLKDSIYIQGKKAPPQIRIKLDNQVGKNFIEASNQNLLNNNNTFTDFFKGLYVVSKPFTYGGTIYYFDLLSSFSNLTMFYHTPTDTTSFTFLINESSARFNMFHNDYGLADNDLISQFNNQDVVQTNYLFVQSMGGVKVKFSFPYIKSLIDNNSVLINKAELVLPVNEADYTSNIYTRPHRLTLVKVKEDGSYAFLTEQADPSFGGNYDESKKEYRFIISSYIQELLLSNVPDYGLVLMVSGSSTRADRIILNGVANNSSKPKLRIYYTIIK